MKLPLEPLTPLEETTSDIAMKFTLYDDELFPPPEWQAIGMVRKTRVVHIDDLDGSEATETVSFGLDGVDYTIDLSEENATRLRDALSTWVSNSRRIGGRARRGTRSATTPSDTAKIREWAKTNGYSVSERGRVAQEIRDAYYAVH